MKLRTFSSTLVFSIAVSASMPTFAQNAPPAHGGFGSRFVGPTTVPMRQVDAALAQLGKAETDEDKRVAEDALREALDKEFDANIAKRQGELEKIRERLAQMEAVLQKRLDNKEKIVGLRLQVLVAETEQLGWSQNSNSRWPTPAAPSRYSSGTIVNPAERLNPPSQAQPLPSR